MKTERRHELQTNELADWIGTTVKDIRPYSKSIIGVAVAIAAVIFALLFLTAQTNSRKASGWTAFFAADDVRDAEALETIAESNGNTLAGLWARQRAADLHLENGARMLSFDRDEASREIHLALKAYESVVKDADDKMLKTRALLGLAQCYESMSDANGAQKQYQRVIDGWPDSAEAKIAESRLKFLEQPTTRQFLTWFERQEPAGMTGLPPVTGAGAMPSIYDDLMGSTDVSLPRPEDLSRPDDATSGGLPFDALDLPELDSSSADGSTTTDADGSDLDVTLDPDLTPAEIDTDGGETDLLNDGSGEAPDSTSGPALNEARP